MAELFLQFIQRAKKRGWSVDDAAQRAEETPDEDPRARLFHQWPQYQKERDADSLYLPPRPNGKNPSEQARKQAQALKMCAAIIGEASDKRTLLVGRTNKVYGIEIKDFRSRLIAIVAKLLNTDLGSLEDSILA